MAKKAAKKTRRNPREKRGRPALDHVRLHISIDSDLANQVRTIAERESRMVSKQIETWVRQGIERDGAAVRQ